LLKRAVRAVHNLSFKKTQNMIMKQILGVHAIHEELGLEPLCFKAFKLMFKYYNHLIKIEQSKDYVYDLLRSAFDEDKQLHSQNCLSWGKSVKQLKTTSNLDTLDLSHVQFSKEMSTYYSGKLMDQLIHIRNSDTGKLRFSQLLNYKSI
jgi:hypothetical protein